MSKQDESFRLNEHTITSTDDKELISKATSDDASVSHAALWLILLLRLTTVTTDERLELRNSKLTPSFYSIHTLCTLWTENPSAVDLRFEEQRRLVLRPFSRAQETVTKQMLPGSC